MRYLSMTLLTAGSLVAPVAAFAASTTAPGGKTAGLYEMGQFFNQVLTEDGGFAIIILGIIMAGLLMVFQGRMVALASVAVVAVLFGFGSQVITAVAGVSADIEFVVDADPASHTATLPVLPTL